MVYKTKTGALWGKQYKFSILAMHGFQREKYRQAFFHLTSIGHIRIGCLSDTTDQNPRSLILLLHSLVTCDGNDNKSNSAV